MRIKPSETLLTGKWVEQGAEIIGDPTAKRIDDLVQNHLALLGRDASGWDALYRDPNDSRLWELTYPQSELQGGGPPQLKVISADEAKAKYGSLAEP